MASVQAGVLLPVGSRDESSASTVPAPWQSFDDDAKWKSFSQAQGNEIWVSRVKVQGMHCSACAARVQQSLRQVPGVLSAQVDAMSSRARITWDQRLVKPSRWLAAVAGAGYALVPIQGADALEQSRLEKRAMLWRWMVAGFCMMQVMMYAWPNYSAGAGEIDPLSDQLLRWASLLLTLPVILFSCGPFFRAAWNDVKHGRISMDLPVSLGIALTFAVSTAAVMDPAGLWGSELYFDSLTMLVFFLLTGRWWEARLKQQVAGQLEAGADQLPVSAQRVGVGGEVRAVPTQSLNVGDVIHVRMGESFAADGVIVDGDSEAEESLLTGEAIPVAKGLNDVVYAGTTNLTAPLQVRLTQVGNDTKHGEMAQLMQSSLHTKPQIVQIADRVAKPFLIVVLLLALASFAFWWSSDPHRAVLSAIAILIVTCPCALALAAPAAFLSSASALAQKGLLVRDLSALERLSRINHFIFDKTGSLTRSQLAAAAVEVLPRIDKEQALARAGGLASHSMHPVSQAVQQYVADSGVNSDCHLFVNVQDVPGQGVRGEISLEGLPPVEYRLGSAVFCGLEPQISGINSREVYLTDGQGLLATFSLNEELRPDANWTIHEIRRSLNEQAPSMPSHLSIMSGDAMPSVMRIAQQLNWQHNTDEIFAACSAQDKLKGLRNLQTQGYRVAMVGDGINDSPVLAAAEVSFAPAQGAALASVKADFLLTAQSLAPIAMAHKQAQRTMRIVKQNLIWALIYNLSCVPLALAGLLSPWMAGLGMALSSLFVLMNSLCLQRTGN